VAERGSGDAETAAGGGVPAASTAKRVIAGRYEVLEALGDGPLLAAFRARDRALNRIVAVKTLQPAFGRKPEIVTRLRAGLSAVLALSHPNLTRVYDVGEDPENGGELFLAEEFVRGVNLQERIARVAPFAMPAATEVAVAVAEALEYAHARGVVHGNLRPKNVLIGPEGQVKVTGFGAGVVENRDESPSAGSDLYALGVLLFEMLTGEIPAVVARGLEETTSPAALNAGVPRALDGLVRKALSARPEARYRSASEVLTDLRAIRDALRYNAPLTWSPLDRAAAPSPAPPAAPPVGGAGAPPRSGSGGGDDTEATIVMPTASGRGGGGAASPRASAAGVPAREPRRGNAWLLSLNLFLLALVLGGAAALAWMAMNFVQPANDVIVPNLVGRTVDEARALSDAKKFTLSTVDERYMDDKKFPANTIFRMEPEPGRHIRENKPVKIWVSRGPRLVEVPDVMDMSVERAKTTLEAGGLRLGQRRAEFDALVAKGTVLRQFPGAGENTPRGTAVDVVLSKGEEPPPVVIPDPATTIPAYPSTPTSPDGTPPADAPSRVFVIRYPVPNDNAAHRIRIDVSDATGTRTVYDEERDAGERIKEDVDAIGERVTIRLYDNDELKSEQTK
jgi:serine/threonine-protein kinase